MQARCGRCCGRCKGGTRSPVRVVKNVGEAELINIDRRSGRSTSAHAKINIDRRSGRSTSAHAKKFACGSGKQLRFLFCGEFLHRIDELARVRFAQREWVVRSERDALHAK